MTQERIHLVSPGAPAASRFHRVGIADANELLERIAESLEHRYRLTADKACLEAEEDDRGGGRDDDARRARDLERALADDRVAAVLALSGGAWFTRLLGRIDWRVLDRRKTRVKVFGFSEMTPLINLVGRSRRAIGIHEATPLFAMEQAGKGRRGRHELASYWADIGRMICGDEPGRFLTGTLVQGRLRREGRVRVIGGNLALMSALLGTPHARSLGMRGRWLALEDVNEKPERIDRMLAHVRAAGLFDHAEGLLLGDFQRSGEDLTDAVLALLRYHLPSKRLPVVARCAFGHTWPVAPLPLRVPLRMDRDGRRVEIRWAKG